MTAACARNANAPAAAPIATRGVLLPVGPARPAGQLYQIKLTITMITMITASGKSSFTMGLVGMPRGASL